MEKFYFTFGCGQPHENCYHVIEAEDWNSARDKMVERFDTKWAFQYNESEWVVSPDDPMYAMKCRMHGIDPTRGETIPQDRLYNLKLIK